MLLFLLLELPIAAAEDSRLHRDAIVQVLINPGITKLYTSIETLIHRIDIRRFMSQDFNTHIRVWVP